MDEILDYLLWKHRHEIACATCMLSGFALGISAAAIDTRGPVFAVATLLAAVVAMILCTRNLKKRDYTFQDEEVTDERRID